MSKLLLLNGPLGCGKTVAVDEIKKRFSDVVTAECKEHLHTLTQQLFNVAPSVYWVIYEDRTQKELPQPEFALAVEEYNKLAKIVGKAHRVAPEQVNITIREAMIYVSEVVCKPAFGSDYFGQVRASKLNHIPQRLYVDDSTGFVDELPPAIKRLGQENILLIRVRGRGTFDGDSRGFIPDGVCDNVVDVYNTYDLKLFVNRVCSYAQGFCNRSRSAENPADYKLHIQ